MVEALDKHGCIVPLKELACSTNRARSVEGTEVSNINILKAVDLLRPHLESLMLDGPSPVAPMLVSLCTGTNISTIKQIKTRGRNKRGARFYESAKEQAVCATRGDRIGALHAATLRDVETLLFSGQFYRSEAHVQIILSFIKSTRTSLRVAMYVLSHARLAEAIKDVAKTAEMMVDHVQMRCNGSQVLALMENYEDGEASRVKVYENIDAPFMQHHKFLIVDDPVTMHGSVNVSNHVMVSAGLLVIKNDERIISILLSDFQQVLNSSRFKVVRQEYFGEGDCAVCPVLPGELRPEPTMHRRGLARDARGGEGNKSHRQVLC